jgi:uncharacterized membrane protein
MGIVLGLAAALLYGGSDFGGGLVSRRLGWLPVNLVATLAAVVLVWAAAVLFPGPGANFAAVAWGAAGGLGGGGGTLVLYRGLARGQMSVVGPVSAVGAAVLPVVVGVVLGDRPGVLGAAGVLVALPAIALVAANGAMKVSRQALADGLTAGTAFGFLFVALARAGADGLWPVVAEQTMSLVVVLVTIAVVRTPVRMTARDAVGPVLVGASGVAATLLYFAATQRGMLSTVAILTSLYPGVTVLLARVIGHERFAPAQRIGLGLCAVAVLAIAVR